MAIPNLLKKVPMFSYSEISADEARSQAREAFKELITSIAINALAYSFIKGPNALLSVSLQVLGSNAINFIKMKRAVNISNKIEIIKEPAFLNSILFNFGSAHRIMTLFHEIGHFLALKAVYRDIYPSITLYPLDGGFTDPHYCYLFFHPFYTDFGNRLGSEKCEVLFNAAGPFFTFLGASSCLILSRIVKNPKINSHLKWISYIAFHGAYEYAKSALDFPQSSSLSDRLTMHDFIRLRGYGYNPLIPTIIYAATPFFLHFSMNAIESCFVKKRDVVIVRPNSICEKIRNLWLAIVASILMIGGVIQIYTWRKT